MKQRLKITMHGMTDVGRNRAHNEDAIAWDAKSGLALLADGMGGHQAGEVASSLAVDLVKASLADILAPTSMAADGVDYRLAVLDAVTKANQEIFTQSQQRLECAGMGTTLVLGLFLGQRVICAHVGDSRAYRLRKGELLQLTSDHSLVQEMIDTGYLNETEGRLSNRRNIITRALGIAADVAVDIGEHEVHMGDVYLLCSDGLTDLVPDNEIRDCLMHNTADPVRAVQQLVALANVKGGRDNISVILCAVHQA